MPSTPSATPNSDIWRKGVVYTLRSVPLPSSSAPYRVTAAFKCGPRAHALKAGFQGLYQRVRTLALSAFPPGATPEIICHGWRTLEHANISTAFITLEHNPDRPSHQPAPINLDFLQPGGASLAELERLRPQDADVVFNEFDFVDNSSPQSHLVTFSYGERVTLPDPIDFAPFVHKAERQARRFHAFLKDQDEITYAFAILQRDSFLADSNFVTVNICFER